SKLWFNFILLLFGTKMFDIWSKCWPFDTKIISIIIIIIIIIIIVVVITISIIDITICNHRVPPVCAMV
ncbi:MAG: hypothetical protein N7Q72_07310, partial [Spiroplasma sp. Tabriz.8]|nr:hypothetical protein [Spiroplasma sp. Tabriz.8]